jgi:hypothetical protein
MTPCSTLGLTSTPRTTMLLRNNTEKVSGCPISNMFNNTTLDMMLESSHIT